MFQNLVWVGSVWQHFKFFLKILNLKMRNYAKKIGSDVILGLKNNKTKILLSNNKLKELSKKINFHIVLIKPNFGCSTEKVYSRNKIFSKKQYFEKKNIKIDKFHIFDGKNDLENSAFKTYPELKKLKNRALAIQKGELVRMTGSGATIVYFSSKVSAKNALKTYRKLNKTGVFYQNNIKFLKINNLILGHSEIEGNGFLNRHS